MRPGPHNCESLYREEPEVLRFGKLDLLQKPEENDVPYLSSMDLLGGLAEEVSSSVAYTVTPSY